MCRDLTAGINLADILWCSVEFNPHLMHCTLASAAAWGITAVQIIPFPPGQSHGEGVLSDSVFAAPRGIAGDAGSHQPLSMKEFAHVFLAILAPNGGPQPKCHGHGNGEFSLIFNGECWERSE